MIRKFNSRMQIPLKKYNYGQTYFPLQNHPYGRFGFSPLVQEITSSKSKKLSNFSYYQNTRPLRGSYAYFPPLTDEKELLCKLSYIQSEYEKYFKQASSPSDSNYAKSRRDMEIRQISYRSLLVGRRKYE